MAKLRSVNTKFWEDPWVENLTPTNKLLFLYLVTNSYANLAGIYEVTIKRICFETGIDNKTVSNGLELFAKDKKAYFIDGNFIVLPNWLKNQNLNANMKKGVVKIIQELPKDVKITLLGNDYLTIQKDYISVLNTLLKYEDEVEVLEVEVLEEECEETNVSFVLFWDSFHSITKLPKTDTKSARTYWDKLKNTEKQKAIDNIQLYYDALNDKKYCKKARTYLSDKNFNDEYDNSHSLGNKQKLPLWRCTFRAAPTKEYECETKEEAAQMYYNFGGAMPENIEKIR